ncbi:MAG: hypothetical protein OXH72_12880 [Caldilineaceae bacterium]|nr:hypothetical protein [Caldilineaceae bacterium]
MNENRPNILLLLSDQHRHDALGCSSNAVVRIRGWKYIYNPGAEDELYDVESDPSELRNLAPDLGYRHVLRRMKVRLCTWMERTGDDIAADDSWKGAPYDLYLAGRER